MNLNSSAAILVLKIRRKSDAALILSLINLFLKTKSPENGPI